MSILKNAIDSIELGIEDFRTKDPKRLVSATRNIFAGVLLLFKHKLAELSHNNDEALLKQKVLPEMVGGEVKWKGQGKKTVDVQQIQERFNSLGIAVDWKSLDEVQVYRNNTEHYYDTQKLRPEVVRQYILDCFNVACDFMRTHLSTDPQSLFDAGIWQSWMAEQSIYNAEEKACSDLLDQLSWLNGSAERHMRDAQCSECSSKLIKPMVPIQSDIESQSFQCAVCGEAWGYDDFLTLACGQAKAAGDYSVYHDGGAPDIVDCPECSRETYDTTEEECASCGAKGPYECKRCFAIIIPEELSIAEGEYCGWCAQVMSHDD